MATFTVQESGLAGTALTFNATNGGGDDFTNDSRTYILAKNDAGVARTFDIVTTQTVTTETLAVEDLSISVAAGTQEIIGPFDSRVFGDTVSLTSYSSTTDLTIAVFKVS